MTETGTVERGTRSLGSQQGNFLEARLHRNMLLKSPQPRLQTWHGLLR